MASGRYLPLPGAQGFNASTARKDGSSPLWRAWRSTTKSRRARGHGDSDTQQASLLVLPSGVVTVWARLCDLSSKIPIRAHDLIIGDIVNLRILFPIGVLTLGLAGCSAASQATVSTATPQTATPAAGTAARQCGG